MAAAPQDDVVHAVQVLAETLDQLSYYDVLELRPGCDYVVVREAFYARAQRFHPDRFAMTRDATLQRAAYRVYKRMTEAYNVLSDPHLRMAYDEARMRGELRLEEGARARRLGAEEREISNHFARLYLRSAQGKFDRGELRAAWVDVQLGMSLESAPPLQRVLDAIVQASRAPESDA